jgi:hypothetical protein
MSATRRPSRRPTCGCSHRVSAGTRACWAGQSVSAGSTIKHMIESPGFAIEIDAAAGGCAAEGGSEQDLPLERLEAQICELAGHLAAATDALARSSHALAGRDSGQNATARPVTAAGGTSRTPGAGPFRVLPPNSLGLLEFGRSEAPPACHPSWVKTSVHLYHSDMERLSRQGHDSAQRRPGWWAGSALRTQGAAIRGRGQTTVASAGRSPRRPCRNRHLRVAPRRRAVQR